MATWTFELVCPRCGKESQSVSENNDPPPTVNCGDCLMEAVEIVEFEIVRATVDAQGKL